MNTKERLSALTGVFLLTLAFLTTLLISATQDRPSWPPTFSNLLAESDSPQARIFFSLGTLAGITLFYSWILFLDPYTPWEFFRHVSVCIGLVILATIPTSNRKFNEFDTNDKWMFSFHLLGVIFTFVVHPIYELLGASETAWFEPYINTYDAYEGKGKIRFWLAIIALCLIVILVLFLFYLAANPETGMAAVTFTTECLLITLLLVDAWFIVKNFEPHGQPEPVA